MSGTAPIISTPPGLHADRDSAPCIFPNYVQARCSIEDTPRLPRPIEYNGDLSELHDRLKCPIQDIFRAAHLVRCLQVDFMNKPLSPALRSHVAESARNKAEQLRRLAEEAREAGDRHREALETTRQERERLREAAETARAASEDARAADEAGRHALVDALRATADAMNATLEQMKVVEEMRRSLREIKDVNELDSN